MNEEKRMAGEWEITHSIQIGTCEVVMGESPNNAKSPYIVADCTRNTSFGFDEFKNVESSADYLEVFEEFTKRLERNVNELKQERTERNTGIEPLGYDCCIPSSEYGDYEGRVCIVKADKLRPEYRNASHQLIYITGGNGARADALGRACFSKELYSGKESRYNRTSILGIAYETKLPDWAKEKLSDIKKQERHEKKKDNRDKER